MSSKLQVHPEKGALCDFHVTPGPKITESQLTAAASLFSCCYGVWSAVAPQMVDVNIKPKTNIRLSAHYLQESYMPANANNYLATAVTPAGHQVGHCLIGQWEHQGERIWWITQLVVHPDFRHRRVAKAMMSTLYFDLEIGQDPEIKDVVGILSANPYAIRAALRIFGRGIQSLDTSLQWDGKPIKVPHAPLPVSDCVPIMKSSPIRYVRDAQMISTLDLVADTRLFMDHREQKRILQCTTDEMIRTTRRSWRWYFGGYLPEGCEYVCVLRLPCAKTKSKTQLSEKSAVKTQKKMHTPPQQTHVVYDIPEWAGTSSPEDQKFATENYNTAKFMPQYTGLDLDGMSFPEFPTSAMENQDAQTMFPLNIDPQLIDPRLSGSPQLNMDPQLNMEPQLGIDPQLSIDLSFIDPQLITPPPTRRSASAKAINNGN